MRSEWDSLCLVVIKPCPPQDANDNGLGDANGPEAFPSNHERDVCIHQKSVMKFDESVNKENIIQCESKSNRVGCDRSKHEHYSITNSDSIETIGRTKEEKELTDNKDNCTEGSIKETGHFFELMEKSSEVQKKELHQRKPIGDWRD